MKFSLERILDPATASVHYNNYRIIDSVTALDDYTVQIKLKSPYAPFLSLLVPYKAGSIISKAAFEERGSDFGHNPVGSGPFQWVSGNPRGDIVLEAFDEYHGGRPKSGPAGLPAHHRGRGGRSGVSRRRPGCRDDP